MEINVSQVKYDYGKLKVNAPNMMNKEGDVIYTPGRFKSAVKDGYVTGTEDIIDDNKGKSQDVINAEVDDAFAMQQSLINALSNLNYVTVSTYASLPLTGAVDTIYRVSNWDGSANNGVGSVSAVAYSEYSWDNVSNEYKLLDVKTQIGEVFDVSLYNAVGGVLATYADLSAALGVDGANVPSGIRKGGMSVKYVHSIDNKYVQYRYMGTAIDGTPNPFLDEANWQGVEAPTPESYGIASSGGVCDYVGGIAKYNEFFVLEEGGYSVVSAVVGQKLKRVANTSRLRTLPIKANKFYIKLKQGYKIRIVIFLDYDFNFVSFNQPEQVEYEISSLPSGSSCFALLIQKDDGSPISLTDNVFDKLISENVLDINANVENLNNATNYRITEIIDDVYDTNTDIISSPAYHQDSNYNFKVSSVTGEYVSSYNNSRATEITLTENILTISFDATKYSGEYGAAFLDNNNNVISGITIVKNGIVVIDATVPIKNGATKFRCSRGQSSYNFDITVTTGEYSTKNKVNTLEQEVFEEETDTQVVNVPIHVYNDSTKWNVSSETGEFVTTSNNYVKSIEVEIEPDLKSISYMAHSYSGNFGYAFLDDSDNLILGVHTTVAEQIEIDTRNVIQQGATKFRCSSYTALSTIEVTKKFGTTIISRIDRLENAVGSFQPYTENTVRILFPTTLEIPNNVFGNDVDSVNLQNHTGYGLLGLSYDYAQYGKPTKLAVFFMGSGSYANHSDTEFPQNMKPYIDFMRKSGYTVLCPYAWDETTDSWSFATPYSIGNYNKAIQYVVKNYNIDKRGIYIWGRSLGASNVLTLAFNSCLPVKAVAMHHPLIGVLTWVHTQGDTMLKKYIFDNDTNYEWTQQYLSDNFFKLIAYENMFNGILDPACTKNQKLTFLTGSISDATWREYVRNQPFPMKIWAAADDANVPYKNIITYFEQVINGGNLCEFRQLPSNYTDEIVTTPNAHHTADYAGPSSTVTTRLGYEVTIANAYIELVEWFERFL